MYISWNDKLETGQSLMDAEHRILVMLFRKLDVGIKTHQSDEMLKDITLEIHRFVEFHFVSEENLMSETQYPDIEAHRKIHTELLMKLNDLIEKIHSHREFPEDLLYFLDNWLSNHIETHDQRLAEHVHKSATRPVAEFIYKDYLTKVVVQGK